MKNLINQLHISSSSFTNRLRTSTPKKGRVKTVVSNLLPQAIGLHYYFSMQLLSFGKLIGLGSKKAYPGSKYEPTVLVYHEQFSYLGSCGDMVRILEYFDCYRFCR